MLDRARQRARQAGVPFGIAVEDISVPEVCPVFGIPLRWCHEGKPAANSPSLDRIDPTRGYVPGNVQVISYRANVMKSNATREELVMFARWVLEGDELAGARLFNPDVEERLHGSDG